MPLLSNVTIKAPKHATRPLNTVFESFLIPALILSNTPQYIRLFIHGPVLISPYYMILLLLFSTMQVVSRIYSPLTNPRLLFARDARQCSSWLFPALLEYFLIATQWLCSLLFLILYLATRSHHPIPPSLTPLIPGSSFPSYAIALSTLLPSILLFSTSTLTLIWRDIDPDDNLSGCWAQLLILFLSSYIYFILSFILTFAHFIPQLLAITLTNSGAGISTLSLGLQIPILFLVAIAIPRKVIMIKQEPRPGSENLFAFEGFIYTLRLILRNAVFWYFCGGNVAVGYVVMAVGQAALFGLSLWYRDGDGSGVVGNL